MNFFSNLKISKHSQNLNSPKSSLSRNQKTLLTSYRRMLTECFQSMKHWEGKCRSEIIISQNFLNDFVHTRRKTYKIYISIQLFTHFYANNTFSMMSTNDKESLWGISEVSLSTILNWIICLEILLSFSHFSLFASS